MTRRDRTAPAMSAVRVLRICDFLVTEDVVAERTEVGPPIRSHRALGNPDEAEEEQLGLTHWSALRTDASDFETQRPGYPAGTMSKRVIRHASFGTWDGSSS